MRGSGGIAHFAWHLGGDLNFCYALTLQRDGRILRNVVDDFPTALSEVNQLSAAPLP